MYTYILNKMEVPQTSTEASPCVETEVVVDTEVLFTVGESFGNYEALEKKLKDFEKVSFSQFWKRDARTVASTKKRLDRPLNPSLKYYEIKYCCIHGGQVFRPQGKGRRNTW